MTEEFSKPEEELAKIERVIRQYEGVLRTAVNPAQRERVYAELKSLRAYRDRLKQAFELPEDVSPDEEAAEDPFDRFSYLALAKSLCGALEQGFDREIGALATYVHCFGREFLVLMSERQLKLDFKHSLERDGFYGRFQELERKLADLWNEMHRAESDTQRGDFRHEVRRRILNMRRSVQLEVHRFFKAVVAFTTELIEDIESGGFKCLNGRSVVRFEPLEGKRHLHGVAVIDALKQTRGYAAEVVEFLNIPEVEAQE